VSDAPKLSVAELREAIADAQELAKGTQLYDAGGLAHLSRYENKLFSEAKGSGAAPYRVTIVFGPGPQELKGRCSCMAARSRPFCKHAAALLVAWARAPESFIVAESAPAEAAAGGTAKKKSVRAGKTFAAELMKHGVEQTATLVRELAVAGVASLGGDRVAQIRALGEALREQRLRRLSARTLDLANLLERGTGGRGAIPPVDYTNLIADMLLTVRKLEKHIGGEPLEDRYVEELVGKTWKKDDRKPVENLMLVEYAFFSRTTSDQFVIRESRFFDVASGTHYSEKQIIPGFLAKRTEPKKSFAGKVLVAASGSVYPGFAPHRLDLGEVPAARPVETGVLSELLAKALPAVGAAIAAFQERRKDVFAPDRLPVAVRVDSLLASGARARVVDSEGAALFLPDDAGLEARMGALLRDAELQALLGDVDVDAALPTLFPVAAVVGTPRGLELRALGAGVPEQGAAAGQSWVESARAAGASAATVSLAEVREELAQAFLTGLPSVTPRTTDPLVSRLKDLGLEKQGALLDATARKPEAADRLDDFIKLYQVLEIAIVRLLGAAHVDRETIERVPTYESVFVPRPAQTLPPAEVARQRAQGALGRYQAAVHYARYYDALPPEELVANIFPVWADGSAAPFVARVFARSSALAVQAAQKALGMQAGRVARMTAIRVLQAAGGSQAEALLQSLSKGEKDVVLRVLAADALDALAIRRGDAKAGRDRRAALEEQVAAEVQKMQSASQKEDRALAIRRLVLLGDQSALSALRLASVNDASYEVRNHAALALGALLDVEMVDTFVRTLSDRSLANDEQAKTAAYALGALGDARGLNALLDAYAEGWKPSILADALRSMGVVALGPLVDLVEARPEILQRKVAFDVVERVPPDELATHLVERIGACGATGPRFAERGALYLKLAAVHEDSRRAVASRIQQVLADPSSKEEKALRRAADKALRAVDPGS
jgi:hypothetical protein